MPVGGLHQLHEAERRLEDGQRNTADGQLRHPFRHDRDHLGPDENEWHGEPAEHGDTDLPPDPALLKHPVHRGGHARAEGGLGVRQPDEVLHAERGAGQPGGDRVDDAHQAVAEQLPVPAGKIEADRSDQQVVHGQDLGGRRQARWERVQVQPDPRRCLLNKAQQRIGEDRHRIVRGGDGELAIGVGRVEPGRALRGGLKLAQRLTHRGQELLGEYGAAVPAPLPFEQLITVVAAQPRERGAHRGLAHPDPLPGPCQVSVLKERAKREQQVEVYLWVVGHGPPSQRHGPVRYPDFDPASRPGG
jgi:hypothetical protein